MGAKGKQEGAEGKQRVLRENGKFLVEMGELESKHRVKINKIEVIQYLFVLI